MVTYNQFVIDSNYRTKGSPSAFLVTPPKFNNAVQMKIKRITVDNIFYNIRTGINDRFFIGPNFKTAAVDTDIKILVVPQGTYPTPEAFCLALNTCPVRNVTYPGTEEALFALTGTPDTRIVDTPIFKYDSAVRKIYIETNYPVPTMTLYRGVISPMLGLPDTSLTVSFTTAVTPGIYRLFLAFQPDLQSTKYIIVKSAALASKSAARYVLPYDNTTNILCTIPLSVPIGSAISYETSVMKDFTDQRLRSWDVELYDDQGNPLEVPPNLRFIMELHFYSDGQAVFY